MAEISDDSTSEEQWNEFLAEFEKLMCEDKAEVSDRLHDSHTHVATITKMFIGFYALYQVQMDELKTVTLFDTGTSINAISSKFLRSMHQQLNVIPANKKSDIN